ncbi:MAG: type III-A CRISPR-associated protein Cas10/Csm1 [bacterium]|nr:type III-A CRISPR-associated protein Cas10/Csm1 [bacterium]
MNDNIYKIAIAGFMHDIGKFAERANMPINKEFEIGNADLYQPHRNNRYTHRHALYTAAFIDSFEKILPKEFNRANWGFEDSFINIAAGHHMPETPLQWIIAMADRVSSGFERDEFEDYNQEIGVRDYKKTRLIPIFEGIDPDRGGKADSLDSYHFRYPLKELSPNPENLFPKNEDALRSLDNEQASKEYNELFNKFIAELEKLLHRYQSIPLWLEHFDSLFMIFASYIPAATVGKVIPNVSLYDHSKATAALAAALYLYHLQTDSMKKEKITDYEEKKFLIVSGDFYGIQSFIFSAGGSTNKAAARLLRGRSFAISLISELAADLICREIGLPPTCSIILNAAGKFTIMAPNTDKVRRQIEAVEKEINDWLIKNFYGESTIGLAWIEASCSDLSSKQIEGLWDSLAKELEKKKYSKIDLERYGGAVKDYLDQFNNELSSKLCPFCGKRPSDKQIENDPLVRDDNNRSACKICRDHIYLGKKLVKSPKMAIVSHDAEIYGDKLSEPIFGKYQVSFDVEGKLNELAKKGKLLKYWDLSISKDGKITKEIAAKFINGYVPVWSEEDQTEETLIRILHGRKSEKTKNELFDAIKEGAIKEFLYLAKMSINVKVNYKEKGETKTCGIEALGVLKADVDNLGLIFTCGLKNNSISHLATLSRQMNNYFAIYLPYLLSKEEKFRDIYTIFGGGDDLFLIGPWNRIIDFTQFLNQSFRQYVCQNKHITISAGLSIHKPSDPVPLLAETAEDALKKAKHNGRDSITLFDETVKWELFEKLNSEVKEKIESWLDKSYINNAMLFRLNLLSEMAKQEKELINGDKKQAKEVANRGVALEDCECLKWHAMFKYNLVRNIGKKLQESARNEAISKVDEAALWLDEYGGAMKIPLWQVIYNQRRLKP